MSRESKSAATEKTRAVIRVESAETQDYIPEPQGLEETDAEEVEELSFIPSAVSEPRWDVCENECIQEGFKFCQLVAIVVEEGGAAHTINLCKQCNVR